MASADYCFSADQGCRVGISAKPSSISLSIVISIPCHLWRNHLKFVIPDPLISSCLRFCPNICCLPTNFAG